MPSPPLTRHSLGTQKKAVIDGGYVDVMLKYTDTPTRVATILTLSRIAEKWFGTARSLAPGHSRAHIFVSVSRRDEVDLP